ncbi:MAG: DUF1858 domain-containing protein [FCB group bacterium]
MENILAITPKTKVLELITIYPTLEELLIKMVPEFKQLKNPILRKTLAKVATLEQASKVGKIAIDELVNRLRKEVGQDNIHIDETSSSIQKNVPPWFNVSKIIRTLDAREMIKNGEHPLAEVIGFVSKMKQGEIYELITPFLPAPLIDKMEEQNCLAWYIEEQDNFYKNYFFKK